MRVIDADELKDHIKIFNIGCGCSEDYQKSFLNAIDAQSTIEPEPKKGRWIKERIYGRGIHRGLCSCCGFDIAQNYKAYKFCPNCGSDNREEGDHS